MAKRTYLKCPNCYLEATTEETEGKCPKCGERMILQEETVQELRVRVEDEYCDVMYKGNHLYEHATYVICEDFFSCGDGNCPHRVPHEHTGMCEVATKPNCEFGCFPILFQSSTRLK